MARAERWVKTPFSRSSALLVRPTSADQRELRRALLARVDFAARRVVAVAVASDQPSEWKGVPTASLSEEAS
jgi:hypothetical protein